MRGETKLSMQRLNLINGNFLFYSNDKFDFTIGFYLGFDKIGTYIGQPKHC